MGKIRTTVCVCTLVHVLHTCYMILTELKKKAIALFYPTRQKNIKKTMKMPSTGEALEQHKLFNNARVSTGTNNLCK